MYMKRVSLFETPENDSHRVSIHIAGIPDGRGCPADPKIYNDGPIPGTSIRTVKGIYPTLGTAVTSSP
jgi:hypothetical protein